MSMLIGDYAIRAVASVENLSALAKFSGASMPNAIVVDCRSNLWSLQVVLDSIKDIFPCVSVVGVGDSAAAAEFISPNVHMIEMSTSSMELSSRITKCLHGNDTTAVGTLIRYKDIFLDCVAQRLRLFDGENESTLPQKEMQLLRLLLTRRGQVVPRAEIQDQLWSDVKVSARTIDSHVSRIRLKLQGSCVTIRCVYGGGYILR